MGVCLALKRYAAICRVEIPLLQQSHHPLHYVCHIKRHKQQLALLRGVYAFVIYYLFVYPSGITHPYRAKQINAKTLRHQFTLYYLHRFLSAGLVGG